MIKKSSFYDNLLCMNIYIPLTVLTIIVRFFNMSNLNQISLFILFEQIFLAFTESLSIVIVTAFFIGLVFSLQIIKEFLYLNATNLVGCILAISFLRELSPVLTSVVVIGKIGSYVTAELSSMKTSEQIDNLYVLGIDPINYLVLPRVWALVFILPVLNYIAFITSLLSGSFICFVLYSIDSSSFFLSALSCLSYLDILKSCLKTVIFALIISIFSCSYGLNSFGGSKGVGKSTTLAVVTSLLTIFVSDFLLSYYMFNNVDSILCK
uniref:ABC transporter permease n=1 Tax=Platysiphonia delicata TaxID=2006979 RepID=A0A1Z1M0X0_9FLOR|nr:hypothetical protein [Platysiphonia delicata]ARW59521.1 hypothetical protein [Platysiphonia delicata]